MKGLQGLKKKLASLLLTLDVSIQNINLLVANALKAHQKQSARKCVVEKVKPNDGMQKGDVKSGFAACVRR